jgi:hypothetical protein
MHQDVIAAELEKALVAVRAGDCRTARRHLAWLSSDRVGGAILPKAGRWTTLLERNRLDTVEHEIVAELVQARISPVALVPLPGLVVAAIAIHGPQRTAAAMGLAPHELARIRPGVPLGPDEPMMRAGLLALLNDARPA